MHNMYPSGNDFSMKEIEDLFFNQTKMLSRRATERRC